MPTEHNRHHMPLFELWKRWTQTLCARLCWCSAGTDALAIGGWLQCTKPSRRMQKRIVLMLISGNNGHRCRYSQKFFLLFERTKTHMLRQYRTPNLNCVKHEVKWLLCVIRVRMRAWQRPENERVHKLTLPFECIGARQTSHAQVPGCDPIKCCYSIQRNV